MPNCVNKVKNDVTDDTCRRCAEINVIKTKKRDFPCIAVLIGNSKSAPLVFSSALIKLIHCGAPQRDVMSDKMVFCVVTNSFYFMLCQSYLLSKVIRFVYKDKWW